MNRFLYRNLMPGDALLDSEPSLATRVTWDRERKLVVVWWLGLMNGDEWCEWFSEDTSFVETHLARNRQ